MSNPLYDPDSDGTDLYCHCGDCGCEWLVVCVPINLDTFADAVLDAAKNGCAKCNGRFIFCGRNPNAEASPSGG